MARMYDQIKSSIKISKGLSGTYTFQMELKLLMIVNQQMVSLLPFPIFNLLDCRRIILLGKLKFLNKVVQVFLIGESTNFSIKF